MHMNANASSRASAHHDRAVHASDELGWAVGVLRRSESGRVSVEFEGGRAVVYRCLRASKLRRASGRGLPRNGGVVVVVHEEWKVLALPVDGGHDAPLTLFAVPESASPDDAAVRNPIDRGGALELFSVAPVDAA
jgi:hypothetical protein